MEDKERQEGHCPRHPSLSDVASYLESTFQTQQVHNNMGAITSITTRNITRKNGTVVTLVYTMRATISSNTFQRRQAFPSGVNARMRELNAVTSDNSKGGVYDDRGHLLASTLGGPSDVLNIVPQHSELNRHAVGGDFTLWYRIEQEIRDYIIQNPGSYIHWIVVVAYGNLQSDNLRPTGFGIQLTQHFANGTVHDRGVHYFSNEAGDSLIFSEMNLCSCLEFRVKPIFFRTNGK